MPLPWALLGAAALGGAAAHLSAEDKNDRARRIADNARRDYEDNEFPYKEAKTGAENAIQVLGNRKKSVLGTSVKQFVNSYEKIKNIQFKETVGIEELKDYEINITNFKELIQWTDIYESKLSSATTGAATGAIATLALGGDITVIGSALSVGGAALAAGEIGVAGAALGAAVAPLAAIAAPAVLFTGISAALKADENLQKAETYAHKVNVSIQKMKTATVKYDAIKERTDMLDELLVELNSRFSYCVSIMDGVISKKVKKNRKKLITSEMFTEDELKLIAVTRALAGSVKSILDTPLLSSNGSLTEESEDTINKLNLALPKLKEQAESVSKINYGAKPKINRLIAINEKTGVLEKKERTSIKKDITGIIIGLVIALMMPYGFWGSTLVFSIIAMFIAGSESDDELSEKIKNFLNYTMWLSTYALFMLNAVEIVNMPYYIITTIIIGLISPRIIGVAEEKNMKSKKFIEMIFTSVFTLCLAILFFAFCHKLLGLSILAKVITGILYGLAYIGISSKYTDLEDFVDNLMIITICIISIILIAVSVRHSIVQNQAKNDKKIESSVVSVSEPETKESETENAQNISTGYIIVPDGRKYVRLAESIDNRNKIAEMYAGEQITVYSIDSDWANISYKGIKGYVELEYISFESLIVDVSQTETEQSEVTSSEPVITEISESKVETNKSETEKKKEIDISNYYGTWEYEDFTLNISEGSKGTVIELCKVFDGGNTVYDFMVETEEKINSEYIKVNYIDDWENTGYAEFTFKDEKIHVNCVKEKASDVDRGYSLDVSANFSRWEEPVYSTTIYPATDYIGMTVDEVVSMYGNSCHYEYIEGGYFINYDFAEGLWIHAGDNANDYGVIDFDDTVNYVYIYNGAVTDNISIGMTFSQIESSSGLSFSLEYDDLNGNGYYATVNTNGYSLGMSFDNSYILRNVLIKKAESTSNASSYTTIESFGYANVDDLRLRATPSLDGEVIGKVTNERNIYIYYKTGDWYYVEFHDGNGNYYDGFAYAEYITIS